MNVEELLDEARAGLERLTPEQALAAARQGDAVIVDIREEPRRVRDGRVPGAVEIDRNVLEWRCAPGSEWRDERVSDPRKVVIVMCDEGYQSSLAAASLQRLGLAHATDIDGGFQRWIADGLPVDR
ncbi:MAG TPA: rhodanese-like domain-containing protein [Thermoleophilaceae bacterium]